MINLKINSISEELITNRETSILLPYLKFEIERYNKVKLKYKTID